MRTTICGARSPWAVALLACLTGLAAMTPGPIRAQIGLRDVVVSVGSSADRYAGNFTAITVPIVDSAEAVSAVGARVSARGILLLHSSRRSELNVALDGGWRQTVAWGFATRDYAPTEWVGGAEATYLRRTGWGRATAVLGVDGRSIWDRPPMPLFKQAGYLHTTGSVGIVRESAESANLDVGVHFLDANYGAPQNFAQLDLLDRREVEAEVGASWGEAQTGLRFFLGLRGSEYESQVSFDPADPFRRDRTIRGGLTWVRISPSTHGVVFLQGGIQGIINRSNSRRPEYDAVRAEGTIQVRLPSSYSLTAEGYCSTYKSYVHETAFARLVPGEEADNESEVNVGLSREVAEALDAHLRLEWARAETDFSGAYFGRVGLSFVVNYRPTG